MLDAEANAGIYWFVQIDPVNISHQTDVKGKIFSAESLRIQSDRKREKKLIPAFFTGSQLKFHECLCMFKR